MIAAADPGDGSTPRGELLDAPLRPVSVTVRPTGQGRFLVGATIAVLLFAWAGLGVGFALMAMIGGALSIAAAVSCWRHASALRISAPPPVTAFAGERFVLDVPVANLAGRAAAFDVIVSVAGGEPGASRVGAFLTRLPAGDETRVDVVHPTLHRGVHAQGALELASSFPLGLFTCRLRFALPHDVLALPRLGTLRRIDRPGERIRGDSGHGGAGRGDEQEVWGIRAWRDGEGLRSVHWKLSARRGRLLVREFRSEPRPPVHVVLATALAEDTRRGRLAFEDAVSLAATLVEHEVQTGHAVRLTLLGRERRTIVCRRGRAAIFPVLRALAEAAPEFGAGVPSADAKSARSRPGERTFVVRVTEGAGAPRARAAAADGPVTVLDVPLADRSGGAFASVFDRRRRPGHELLLGVRR